MKQLLIRILIALFLCTGHHAYAMKRPYSDITPSGLQPARTLSETLSPVQTSAASAPSGTLAAISQPIVEAYFVPQDFIQDKLFDLLDAAQHEILVAMYLITDDSLIKKLITLKRQKNINIAIIMDESSFQNPLYPPDKLTSRLKKEKIALLIYPSEPMKKWSIKTIMHNKFIVIDGRIVWTGSANYTQPTFNFHSSLFNFENIMIVRDSLIGQKYVMSFMLIKDIIIQFYVDIIAHNSNNDIPKFIQLIMPTITELRYRNIIESKLKEYNSSQQTKVLRFLGFQNPSPAEKRPSEYQIGILSKYLTDDQIDSMTYQEAHDFIWKLLKKGRQYVKD